MQVDQVIRFVLENREVLTTFLIALVAVVKLTAWGRAQALALDAVVGVIERVGASDVKREVAWTELKVPDSAKDAIRHSVAKADPKKTPKSLFLRVLREVFRGL